jgi:hypothetical protein
VRCAVVGINPKARYQHSISSGMDCYRNESVEGLSGCLRRVEGAEKMQLRELLTLAADDLLSIQRAMTTWQ